MERFWHALKSLWVLKLATVLHCSVARNHGCSATLSTNQPTTYSQQSQLAACRTSHRPNQIDYDLVLTWPCTLGKLTRRSKVLFESDMHPIHGSSKDSRFPFTRNRGKLASVRPRLHQSFKSQTAAGNSLQGRNLSLLTLFTLSER